MAQLLVIKNGQIIATHKPGQDVVDKYPGCEVVLWDGEHVLPDPETGEWPEDPRSTEQQAADSASAAIAAALSTHASEEEQGVTLANGWRMRYTDVARANYAEVKALIDLAGPSLPGVTIYDADSGEHQLTCEQAVAIIAEYAVAVATERQRQFAELAALGW